MSGKSSTLHRTYPDSKHSIAVLISDDVPLPKNSTPLFDELPCPVTVCTPENAPEALNHSDALLVWDTDQNHFMQQHWELFAHLQWIHVAVTGVDAFMFPELQQSPMTMTSASGIYNDSIAEFVTYSILARAKRSALLDKQQRTKQWKHIHSEMVKGAHAVIYGVGSIGRTVGMMLHALGMQVRGIDPGVTEAEGFSRIYPIAALAEAAAWADHFVICAPLTSGTMHSLDESIFSVMKPTSHVINVGRGPIVDEHALIRALDSGQIGAASLDVFEQEPLAKNSPLWDMPSVSISPHISGDAGDFEIALIRQFIDLAQAWLNGTPFSMIVDKQKGYAIRQN